MERNLEGRVALVTGASSGIGASVVRRFLAAGARVHGVARRQEALNAVSPEHLLSGQFVPHTLDVSDTAGARAFAQRLSVEDPIDTLICAAGTNVPRRRFAELDDESFDHIMKTNVYGVFTLVSATLEQLRENHGDVVIISSIAASWPDHSGAAYGASKSALLGLARGASRDEHGNGIRVCSILPGIVDTPILDLRPSPPPREVRDWAVHPDDVAEAAYCAVSLPPRTNIAEISVVATRLQSLGNTQAATPELPLSMRS
jgi:serine 3-dehydrogenase